MKVVLIACARKKSTTRMPARALYISPLFQLSLRYAEALRADKIFVLSAKHGLLGLDDVIDPYEQTLNAMPLPFVKAWADRVAVQLQGVSDCARDEFIFLAGARYRKYLAGRVAHARVPMEGLGIGKQLRFLKEGVHGRV